jgi:hypothetical protein
VDELLLPPHPATADSMTKQRPTLRETNPTVPIMSNPPEAELTGSEIRSVTDVSQPL